jgi:hypothetical protein
VVVKLERERSLGRPKRRSEKNIGMVLHDMECEDTDWVHLAQDKDSGWLL